MIVDNSIKGLEHKIFEFIVHETGERGKSSMTDNKLLFQVFPSQDRFQNLSKVSKVQFSLDLLQINITQ